MAVYVGLSHSLMDSASCLTENFLRRGEDGLTCLRESCRQCGTLSSSTDTVDVMTVNRELCVQQRRVTVMFPVCDQISALSFIVFSGQVNGRTYKADLELQADVATERCCWEMKSLN